MEVKSVIQNEFDRSGRYESGLKSLVKCLQWAFRILLATIIGMVIYFISWGGYFSVEPQQAVIVLRFGKILDTFETGGHWFLPYPVNTFVRVQTNQEFLNVDFIATEVKEGETKESLEPGRDYYLLTGDANIIHTSWTIGYKVSNPERYYTALLTPANPVLNNKVVDDEIFVDADGFEGARGPQTMLRNLFRQAVIKVTGSFPAEAILSSGQSRYSEAVQREFAAAVRAINCGIDIESVVLDRAFPPSKTSSAFAEVTAAGTMQSTLRNQAETYRVETENDTQARCAEIKAAAETYRKETVSSVKAESNYFSSILAEYHNNPRTVLMALYTSTIADAMRKPSEELFVIGTGAKAGRKVWLQLNPEPKVKLNEAAKKAQDAKEK